MSSEVTVAIISTFGLVIAAGLAIWGFSWQKSNELEKSLIELRRDAYRSFLEHLPNLGAGTRESRDKYNSLVSDLTVVGSDDVLYAVGEFTQYFRGTLPSDRKPDVYKKLIAKIVMRMRRDCFSQTKLDLDTTSNLIPFE